MKINISLSKSTKTLIIFIYTPDVIRRACRNNNENKLGVESNAFDVIFLIQRGLDFNTSLARFIQGMRAQIASGEISGASYSVQITYKMTCSFNYTVL